MNLSTGQIIEFLNKDGEVAQGMVLQTGGKGVRVLQLNRRETTVTERSVLHHGQVLRVSLADLDACAEASARVNELRVEQAAMIDLAELYELLVDENRLYPFEELVEFVCEPGDPDRVAALLRRLNGEQWYFRQKKDGFLPVSREEVAELQRREALRLAEEREKDELTAEFRRLLSRPGEAMSPAGQKAVPLLLELLLHEDEAVVPKKIREVAERVGLGNARKLFSFLTRLGVVKPDEHLALLKHKVPREFPPACLAAAGEIVSRSAAGGGSERPARRDLRDLRVWVLDNETTRDRDDGFSIGREADGSYQLWIHIADAAEFVVPGSELDVEARRRGTTLYFPEGNIPMFPEALSENFLSLNQDGERCVITQRLRIAPDGTIIEQEFLEALIRVTDVAGYRSADERLADEPELATAIELAGILKDGRRRNGGVIVPQRPEGKITLEGGQVHFDLATRDSPCQDMVAEFMIWTNHLSGLWFRDRGVPGVFRVQEAPAEPIEFPETFHPVAFYRMIRALSRTQVVSTPGKHGCLGVEPYLQITSPIRRYSDLLLQRQVKRVLAGVPPQTTEELMQVFLQSEAAAGVGDGLMSQRYRHFLITYLKQRVDESRNRYTAMILDVGTNDCQLFIEDLGEMMHCRKPTLEIKPGMRVEVKFSHLEPFDNFWRCEVEKVME